jgi:hypothetical protein
MKQAVAAGIMADDLRADEAGVTAVPDRLSCAIPPWAGTIDSARQEVSAGNFSWQQAGLRCRTKRELWATLPGHAYTPMVDEAVERQSRSRSAVPLTGTGEAYAYRCRARARLIGRN